MKRKDLVVGQKYVVFAANSWNANAKSQNYFDEDSWGKPTIVEIVDASEYRTHGYYWNRNIAKKDSKELKWRPRKDDPKISEDGYEKTRYRNVLVKSLDENDEGSLQIVPLNAIRFPLCVWKRRSIVARSKEQNKEAEEALKELVENSVRRHWLKTEGKLFKDKLRKASRKLGFEITALDGFEEGLAYMADKPTYEAWDIDSEVEQVLIPYHVFLKLLEAV